MRVSHTIVITSRSRSLDIDQDCREAARTPEDGDL
jgi:hypothetical protein